MAITEHFKAIDERPALRSSDGRTRWTMPEMAVLIIGGAAVAALSIAELVYDPSMQQKEEAARVALTAEHMKVCDGLGKAAGSPDRDRCLTLLDDLNAFHKQTYMADAANI